MEENKVMEMDQMVGDTTEMTNISFTDLPMETGSEPDSGSGALTKFTIFCVGAAIGVVGVIGTKIVRKRLRDRKRMENDFRQVVDERCDNPEVSEDSVTEDNYDESEK